MRANWSAGCERAPTCYPQTQAPGYSAALRAQARRRLDEPRHRLFGLVDREALTAAADREGALDVGSRLALDPGAWIDGYSPALKIG